MSKLQGKIEVLENFYMPQLDRYRTIRIYLPPSYEEKRKAYPVIYMHDGQNLFDKETSAFGMAWEVSKVLDKIYSEDNTKEFIVIGIDNSKDFRYNEYSPWKSEIGAIYLPHAKKTGNIGGEGFKYGEFICNTLKPYIDENYRTLEGRKNTAICGSSMGGLISICIGIKYQNIFGKIGALSSAIYYCNEEVKRLIGEEGKKEDTKIYLSVGTNETSDINRADFSKIYVESTNNLYKYLENAGFGKEEVVKEIIEGDEHNEKAWKKRFPNVIKYLFK